MNFDGGAQELHLDSVYPAGCWQVGRPDKPVFTSAYSEPFALVTDTILPHPPSTTCYAEFSSMIDDQGYLGKYISFRHRMDMDTLQSFGWLEFRANGDPNWTRAGGWGSWFLAFEYSTDWSSTDSGLVVTGRNAGWSQAYVALDCIAVLTGGEGDRGGAPSMRFRFVFQGDANPAARDGWMIDDVRLSSRVCEGGIAEEHPVPLSVSPDPASDRLHVAWTGGARPGRWQVFDANGRAMRCTGTWLSDQLDVDVQGLAAGIYVLHVDGPAGSQRALFSVLR